MEIINRGTPKTPIKSAIFDFDGTISTLRHGWESVMEPLMIELLGEESGVVVRDYISESTGLQTIFQMKWLAEQVKQRKGRALDPWDYKTEYNNRLMAMVSKRRQMLVGGMAKRGEFLISGSETLLWELCKRGVSVYIASGTDDPDVKAEVEALGLTKYAVKIAGAPIGKENCSKERVIDELISGGMSVDELAVVGDGKVEIAIGHKVGARTLGVASNEEARCGVDMVKRDKLIKAGANVIVGDFVEVDKIMRFFMGE